MAVNKVLKPDRKQKRRPGVVSKNKSSYNKNSKYYKKRYRGQGRPGK